MRLTIESVLVRGVDLALARPVETASGVMTTTPLALVDVRTAEGVVGRSYVRCYTPLALDPLVRLLRNVGALLAGSPGAPAVVADRLHRQFRLVGPQGLTGMAMAGIDMALWDARARACEVPLVTLLGGVPKAVPAYASLRTMAAQAAAAEAEELLDRGFTALKVKVGGRDLAADLETVHALRKVAGDGVRLMVDYNQSLSVREAIERARVLDDLGLHWIEEPTRADDVEGHARIAAAAETAIQLGENWWGPDDMARSIAAGASDHVMLDVMKLGGVTGWLQAAALARAASLPASSHTFPEVSAHLLAVTPTAHYLEYLDHAAPVLAEPVRIRDGHVLISEQPGSGIDWDEAVLSRLTDQGEVS
jgi:mandelate racemase